MNVYAHIYSIVLHHLGRGGVWARGHPCKFSTDWMRAAATLPEFLDIQACTVSLGKYVHGLTRSTIPCGSFSKIRERDWGNPCVQYEQPHFST